MNNVDYYGMKSPTQQRGGWLIFFGILEAILAFFCLIFMIGVIAATQSFAHDSRQVSLRALTTVAAIYGLLALAFVAGSVGTFMRSNWGRVLMIFVSAFWLGIGILSLISVVAASIFMQANQQNATGLRVVVVIIGIFMVALPAIFLRFYTLESVRASFQAPTRSLAPKLPVSMWIAAGLIIFGAVSMWGTSQFFPLFTFFGLIINGKIARELMLLRAAIDAVLCAFFLKRDLRSWIAIVGVTILFGVSNLVTNLIRTPQQIYAHVSWAHPERMNMSSFWFSNTYRLGGTSLLTLAFLGLLLYTRRYFKEKETEPRNENEERLVPI